MSDFLGTGWAFPVSLDARKQVTLTTGATDIEQAIRIILDTPKGQRVMRPEFGSQLHQLIFASNDANTAGLAEYYVQDSLRMWEPRINILRVDARPHPEQENVLAIEIEYEIKATHDRRSLVYPFYRVPEDE
jgi:hypothetical protein